MNGGKGGAGVGVGVGVVGGYFFSNAYSKRTHPALMSLFDQRNRLGEDGCALDARERGNSEISTYTTFNLYPDGELCEPNNAKVKDFALENYMRVGGGYGVTDACFVDTDTDIRQPKLTTDRGRTQLYARMFQAVPDFSHGQPQPTRESAIMQGTDTSYERPCEANHTDRVFMPMIPCLSAEVQNPAHIVPPWTRGGDSTRDTLRQEEFLRKNGYSFDGTSWSKRQCGATGV